MTQDKNKPAKPEMPIKLSCFWTPPLESPSLAHCLTYSFVIWQTSMADSSPKPCHGPKDRTAVLSLRVRESGQEGQRSAPGCGQGDSVTQHKCPGRAICTWRICVLHRGATGPPAGGKRTRQTQQKQRHQGDMSSNRWRHTTSGRELSWNNHWILRFS